MGQSERTWGWVLRGWVLRGVMFGPWAQEVEKASMQRENVQHVGCLAPCPGSDSSLAPGLASWRAQQHF